MNINELRDFFINTEFFYYEKYLGVVRDIEYDNFRERYCIHLYEGSNCIDDEFFVQRSYMLDYYINELRKIRLKFLRSRYISRLVHFTPVSNLESILENGLLSRSALDYFNISYVYSDFLRLDGKLDFISSSISFPNYRMFYTKRMEDTDVDWVILSIDSKILIDKMDTQFYRTNCASNDPSKCRYNPCSNDALSDMFYNDGRDPHLPFNYTTDPQAEVMLKYEVQPSYISCVETKEKNEKVHSLALNSGISYNSRSNLFTYRQDYKKWQNIN